MSCQKKNKSKIQVKKSKTQNHRGGSYASDLVMAASKGPVVMNDYVTNPRVRDGPNADFIGLEYSKCGQCGGSAASSMTMENLNNIATTNKYAEGWKVAGDINSLNTYQPSGGKRKTKNSKSNKPQKSNSNSNSRTNNRSNSRSSSKSNRKSNSKSNNNKSKSKRSKRNENSNNNQNQNQNRSHHVKGGASAYMADFYAIDSNRPQPNAMWNPPSMPKAGSGAPMVDSEGANMIHVGSPLV